MNQLAVACAIRIEFSMFNWKPGWLLSDIETQSKNDNTGICSVEADSATADCR
jgi:hypothetical protein